MSKNWLFALALGGLVGLAAYLSSQGMTLNDVNNWFRRHTGSGSANLKSVPYTNYGPVVVPGR